MQRKSKRTPRGVQIVKDYMTVFSSPQGRAVLHDLMNAHGMLRSTYTKDPSEALFKEGERNVVLRILSILQTDVKQLLERIEEHEKSVE